MTNEHGINFNEYLRWRVASLLDANSELLVRIESLIDDVGNLEARLSAAIDELDKVSGERDNYRKRFHNVEDDLIYYRGLVTNAPEKEKSLEQKIAFAFQAHAVDEFGAIMWLARVIDRMQNVETSETGLK